MANDMIIAAGLAAEVQGLITTWLGGPTDIWKDGVQHRVRIFDEKPDGTVLLRVVSLDGTQGEGTYEVRAVATKVSD